MTEPAEPTPVYGYSFDPTTKVYIGAEALHADPLTPGEYLLPASATLVAPPATESGTAFIWNGTAWTSTPDYRGQTAYNTSTAAALLIQAVGAIPTGYTLLSPSTVPYPEWNGTAWVTNTAAQTAATVQSAVAAAIEAGLTIESTSTPEINGVYSCSATSVANFNAVETYVLRNNTFPGPSSEQAWVLQNGSVVTIPSTTVFNALATAIANYVALIQLYAYSNGAIGSLPPSTVTIA